MPDPRPAPQVAALREFNRHHPKASDNVAQGNQPQPGDKIRVHAGTYDEAVTVDKSLKLIGDGNVAVIIDAGCGACPTG